VELLVKTDAATGHYIGMLPPPATPRGNVLIVDDDAGVRDVCTTLLHALGYGAAEASTGPKALETLVNNENSQQSVQLVLLDIELPGMHGRDVLRAVKRNNPGVRVLVMSGKPGRDLQTFLSDGADGVLQKPFGMAKLDASVGAALRN
jgi:two-component system cell cycle sensor histidine kinase/response regulator CckA